MPKLPIQIHNEDSQCLLCKCNDETISPIIYDCPELKEVRPFDTTHDPKELLTSQMSALVDILNERKKRMHARAPTLLDA